MNSISRATSAAALLELDARVHVLRVLAEDHDVDLLGVLHRAGYALVILHGPNAGVEVKKLTQGNIQRADSAADRCRQAVP